MLKITKVKKAICLLLRQLHEDVRRVEADLNRRLSVHVSALRSLLLFCLSVFLHKRGQWLLGRHQIVHCCS